MSYSASGNFPISDMEADLFVPEILFAASTAASGARLCLAGITSPRNVDQSCENEGLLAFRETCFALNARVAIPNVDPLGANKPGRIRGLNRSWSIHGKTRSQARR